MKMTRKAMVMLLVIAVVMAWCWWWWWWQTVVMTEVSVLENGQSTEIPWWPNLVITNAVHHLSFLLVESVKVMQVSVIFMYKYRSKPHLFTACHFCQQLSFHQTEFFALFELHEGRFFHQFHYCCLCFIKHITWNWCCCLWWWQWLLWWLWWLCWWWWWCSLSQAL